MKNVNSFSTKAEINRDFPKKVEMTNFMKTLSNLEIERPKQPTNVYSTP